MEIALIYNLRPDLDRKDPKLEKYIEGDEWKTIKGIGDAIEQNNHSVTYFPTNEHLYRQLELAKDRIDLIFNYSEGYYNAADREAHVPTIAEILRIPYTGPSPLSSALILNKSKAKEIWKVNHVKTAEWQVFESPETQLNKDLDFPLIVKPNNEGSGIGIKDNSIVNNQKELINAINNIINSYHQPALVAEYLPGREFTVALLGNGEDIITLPIIEVNFAAFPKGTPQIDTYEAKFVYGVTGEAEETEFCPADVTKDLEQEIIQTSIDAYKSIGCRDFARVDLRLNQKQEVCVMEVNHPPGLMSDASEMSFFTIASNAHGWSFAQTIGEIINISCKRLDIKKTA